MVIFSIKRQPDPLSARNLNGQDVTDASRARWNSASISSWGWAAEKAHYSRYHMKVPCYMQKATVIKTMTITVI